ncbi:thioredoxin family protein [Mycoplasma tauri]|uniref:Thioredoxin n=1 Tax=Mycoplasma tauri TaxID=547987 RepID=A0A953NCS4_9MOLU|nr:thioredoxin family protein [Mycoplasma tauri]MBZ4195215.1 thioredoxin family protein [Mycoplasma tauri]MBZ4204024.1 thioredoxin family protein [Mycoplasma tauri]MBZ4217972.1 thioredoxin family protein [Mycoplasma tauri]MBZ4226537.1 thioredoxin family protein [Mycoplasma tauri]
MIKEISQNEYINDIKNNEKDLYILVFHALWCGPCRMFKESLLDISEKDNVKVYRINVDENSELSSEFQVRSIPKWFIFKDGKEISSHNGYMPYEDLKKIINEIQ